MRLAAFLLLLSLVIAVLLAGCQPAAQPVPAATPVPELSPEPPPEPVEAVAAEPEDVAELAEAEVRGIVWAKLPSLLPAGYAVDHFYEATSLVQYEGGGQWSYSVSGMAVTKKSLPEETVKKDADYWVRQKPVEITRSELLLKATYYENSDQIRRVMVERGAETSEIRTEETPVPLEFTLNYMKATFTGIQTTFEGQLQNTGAVPLQDITVVFVVYDQHGEVVARTDVFTEPATVPVFEKAKMHGQVMLPGVSTDWGYDYLFLTSTEKLFKYDEASPDDRPRFYYDESASGI